MYIGKYPVYVSHAKEIEQLLYFTSELQHRLQRKGKASGKQYDCLCQVRRKCSDLLLKMYAEESDILLMDLNDREWVRKIVGYVETHLRNEKAKVG